MAIYHFSGQIMSRISKHTGKPKSPLAAAAYRSGEKLVDEVDNQSFFYKREVQPVSHILIPNHAPEWAKDRERLWNEVNKVEKNYNAQFAREFNVALPVELSNAKQEKLVLEFCQQAFVDRGMVADIAIHRDDEKNPHFHVMLTIRPFNEDGTWGNKAKREYRYDENGDHIIDKNGKKAFYKVETTDWNKKEVFNEWRKLWAEKVNFSLKNNGIHATISHLSNEARGIEYIPTIHEGFTARKMEKNGLKSDRISINENIKIQNNTISEIKKYKEQKAQVLREQKFARRFSPTEKQQLTSIAKELKFFVNSKTVLERKEQLNDWKKSIQFSFSSDTKIKQLSRIDREEQLLEQAEEILLTESNRFIKQYYPKWDVDSLNFEEKTLLVKETISQKRLLTDEEIEGLEETSLVHRFNYEMDKIYANPYAFAMTLDHRIQSVMDEKSKLENTMNITVNSSEIEFKKASKGYPKEFKQFKNLIKHLSHVFNAKELIEQLYSKQMMRLYPDLDVSKLSFAEKDLFINAAEYYGQPVTLESVAALQKYSPVEQVEILGILNKSNDDNMQTLKELLLDKYQFNIENPHHMLFFKNECLQNIEHYPEKEIYVELLKQIDPVTIEYRNVTYSEVKELNNQIDDQLVEYNSGQQANQILGVTNGLLQGLLENRSFSSKKQFEEDLKAKSKKMKRNNAPSL